MVTGRSRARLACAAVLLTGAAACSSQPSADTAAPVIPPAQPTVAATGPGTYVGEAVNTIGSPVPVLVTIAADVAEPQTPDARAVGGFLRSAAAELGAPAPTTAYLEVEIDNTGQIDPVPLPDNVDVLDPEGRGANFRPAYEVAQESLDLLPGGTELVQTGAVLVRRLQVRENSVRPGQVVTVPYVSQDAVRGVSQVVVNGELARKQP